MVHMDRSVHHFGWRPPPDRSDVTARKKIGRLYTYVWSHHSNTIRLGDTTAIMYEFYNL